MIWVKVRSKHQPQFNCKNVTPQDIIDIPIIISYIIELQHFKYGPWAVNPDLQTPNMLDLFSFKIFNYSR